jgi:flagellar motility protein MotE (MotC chaperone)
MIKYAIYGAVGLVVVLGIAFGTLMFLGGDETSEVPAEDQVEEAEATESTHKTESAPSHADAEVADEPKAMSFEDSILAAMENDESILDEIMANLEVLDYVPDDEDFVSEESGMSVEDSIEQVNWIEAANVKLAERESAVTAREKELKILDSKVSQKIVLIEQAESNRVSKLAKLYDGMDSRAVARLIANLDDNTVVSLLPRMKLKNASAVLSLMPPPRAARLSKQMITIAEN